MGQRALAEEHAAQRAAFELLAGQLHAGHPPGVLHAGQVGADLLGKLHGDAVVTRRGHLGAEGRVEVRGGQRGRALEAAAGQDDALRGAHGVLDTVGLHDHATYTRVVRHETNRRRPDTYVDAVAQAGLEQGADQGRACQPGLVDAHAAEHPERQRVLRHPGRQRRPDEPRGLTQPLW